MLNDSRMVEFLREWTAKAVRARPTMNKWSAAEFIHIFAVSFAFAILYVAIEPRHAQGLPIAFSTGMWLLQSLVGFTILMGSTLILKRSLGMLSYVFAVPLASLGITIVSLCFEWATPALRHEDWKSAWSIVEWTEDYTNISVQAAIIWAIYCSSLWLSDSKSARNEPALKREKLSVDFDKGIFKKLPLEIGNDIVAVSSEQHYLRVYTLGGNSLVLGTMEEAMVALKPLQPLRLHRSHIVVMGQIVTLDCKDFVQLDCGLKFPVSRRQRKTVLQAIRQKREAGELTG